jgi:rhodanese-related sulfurtransferase
LLNGNGRLFASDNVMQQVSHREVFKALTSGALIIDVLPDSEYESAHIRSAIHLPLPHLLTEAKQRIPTGSPVIVYCRDNL